MQVHGGEGGAPKRLDVRRILCRILYVNSHLYCQFMATCRLGPELYFYISRSNPWNGPWQTHQSVGLLWKNDQLVAETSTWQHSQQTDIHVPGGIRTQISASERPLGSPQLILRLDFSSQFCSCSYVTWRIGCRWLTEFFGIFSLHCYRDIHRQKWKRICTDWKKRSFFSITEAAC